APGLPNRVPHFVRTHRAWICHRVANGLAASISRNREPVLDPSLAAFRCFVPVEWRFKVDGICNAPQSAYIWDGRAAYCALSCRCCAESVFSGNFAGNRRSVLRVCIRMVVHSGESQDDEAGGVKGTQQLEYSIFPPINAALNGTSAV